MKKWNCWSCNAEIEVYDEYKPIYCCNGMDCGCLGEPVNPMFCDECEKRIFGNSELEKEEN